MVVCYRVYLQGKTCLVKKVAAILMGVDYFHREGFSEGAQGLLCEQQGTFLESDTLALKRYYSIQKP